MATTTTIIEIGPMPIEIATGHGLHLKANLTGSVTGQRWIQDLKLMVSYNDLNLYTIVYGFTIPYLSIFNEFLSTYTRYKQKLLGSGEPGLCTLDLPLQLALISIKQQQ